MGGALWQPKRNGCGYGRAGEPRGVASSRRLSPTFANISMVARCEHGEPLGFRFLSSCARCVWVLVAWPLRVRGVSGSSRANEATCHIMCLTRPHEQNCDGSAACCLQHAMNAYPPLNFHARLCSPVSHVLAAVPWLAGRAT